MCHMPTITTATLIGSARCPLLILKIFTILCYKSICFYFCPEEHLSSANCVAKIPITGWTTWLLWDLISLYFFISTGNSLMFFWAITLCSGQVFELHSQWWKFDCHNSSVFNFECKGTIFFLFHQIICINFIHFFVMFYYIYL